MKSEDIKYVIIQAGGKGIRMGRYAENKPKCLVPVKGIPMIMNTIEKYKDKEIAIFGGGDSALDWSVELSKIAKKIHLIHRRDDFRGAEHTENQMRELVKKGKIELKLSLIHI